MTRNVETSMDLLRSGPMTLEEQHAYRGYFNEVNGRQHVGFNFWIDNDRTETLKLFMRISAERQLVEQGTPITVFSYVAFYALHGYHAGVRYCVHGGQRRGLTKSQWLEGLSLAFLTVYARGLETVSEALLDYEWVEPDHACQFPEGWSPDRAAFDTSLDVLSEDLSATERNSILGWYEQTIGEIPPTIQFLAHHQPRLLKAYRICYERCLGELPKQVLPTTLLHLSILRGRRDGIRENLLLSRAFGVSHTDIVALIGNASTYGFEALGMVQEVAGEILANWSGSS